jgi:2-haloacid dehalogenase
MKHIDHIVFDLGGVLIDWNPRYLYKKLFSNETDMEHFLDTVCTSDWNEQQDAGVSLEQATQERISKFPEFEDKIIAFYGRWQEMLGGPILPTVKLMDRIRAANKHSLTALTNWSAETFPYALENYDFLHHFEDIIVSGVEKCKKPDPRIYQILIDRTGIEPMHSLFIDDSLRNINAAQKLGFQTIHFHSVKAIPEIEAIVFPGSRS